MPSRTMSHGNKLILLAALAGLAAGSVAQGQTIKPVPQGSRPTAAAPVVLGRIPLLRTGPGGRPSQHPGGFSDACNIVASHTDANFSGGSFVAQAGFAEQEQAAATYVLTAADFPIKINMTEVIVVTSNATTSTTTQWTLSYYSGTPSTGTLVDFFSSDGTVLPHIVMPPGTNGTNLQFSIDPQDPEQIIIPDDGTHSFTVAFRIDHHNNPPANPCTTSPPTSSNAFPCTDVSGVTSMVGNWLFALSCPGLSPCAGWANFASISPLCRPSGDWVQRTTWSSVSCTPGVGACCLPSGVCQVLTTSECQSQNGTYRGDGSSCATANCPLPTGACCFSGGSCLNLTEANCGTAGGTWLGGGTSCAAGNTCPTGACCLPLGNCITGVTGPACTAQGGTFRGAGTTCASPCPQPTGACCIGTGCLALTQADCGVIPGGVWQGALTTCGIGQCAQPCYINCDGSTIAPVANVADYICFMNKFAAGDSYANCDQSTIAPVLNVNDFVCFNTRFAAGCP